MYDKGIFVFGSKILPETNRDVVSSLPLELSWKIFSYLDDMSLRVATRTHKMWQRIVLSNNQLRKRLNHFELAIKLGSDSLARFYKKHKKQRKVNKEQKKMNSSKNYLPLGLCEGKTYQSSTTEATVFKKRSGEELVIYSKRYKLY